MAISEAFSGTNSSWGTEYSLTNASTTIANQTAAGVYQLFLDLSAMASGDTYTVRIYEKVRSASTRRIVLEHVVTGAQSPPNWAFPSMVLLNGWDMTLICTAGTNTRAIEWSIRKVA
jgi:flagellar basal body L-ring protein FlgH